MTVDTTALRTRSANLAEMELPGSARALAAAADEIDALRRALAEVPHAPLCQLLMVRDDEPCSCAKSAAPAPRSPLDLTQINRLEVVGPERRELIVRSHEQINVALHLQDDGRTLKITYRDTLAE